MVGVVLEKALAADQVSIWSGGSQSSSTLSITNRCCDHIQTKGAKQQGYDHITSNHYTTLELSCSLNCKSVLSDQGGTVIHIEVQKGLIEEPSPGPICLTTITPTSKQVGYVTLETRKGLKGPELKNFKGIKCYLVSKSEVSNYATTNGGVTTINCASNWVKRDVPSSNCVTIQVIHTQCVCRRYNQLNRYYNPQPIIHLRRKDYSLMRVHRQLNTYLHLAVQPFSDGCPDPMSKLTLPGISILYMKGPISF